MNLREALAKICEIEMGVEFDLEGLGTFKPVRAWPFWPQNNAQDVFETPCFFHTWRLVSKVNRLNAFRELNYEIGIQLAIAPSSTDPALQSELAVAVHEALMNYFDANMMLEASNALIQNLRSEAPTLTRLEWPPDSGLGYVGLDYHMDLKIHDQPLVGV